MIYIHTATIGLIDQFRTDEVYILVGSSWLISVVNWIDGCILSSMLLNNCGLTVVGKAVIPSLTKQW